MPLFERSYNDIVGSMLLDLTSNTRINRVSPGSKTRALLEIVSRNLNQAYKVFDINLARAFLSGATGTYIDLIGELLGTPRLGTETAKASTSSRVIKFYVNTGTFGAINGAAAITIPAGTIVSTRTDSSGIIYKLPVGVVLSAAVAEQFIPVEALSPGESSNVGADSLLFHNFTGYTDNANNTLKVTNISGIFNGANIENDVNYKFRISKSALASEAGNPTAVLLAALSTPGVANVLLQNRATGIGTFKVLIKSVTPSVSLALIDNVQAAIESVSSLGVIPIADRPDETGMSFTLTMRYHNGTSTEEKDVIEEQVRLAIADYVNSLDIAEDFIVNQLVERVLSVSPNIKDIGRPNKPFDEMFIFKESRLRDAKLRQELIENYIPQGIERVIIEPTLKEPITILRGN